MSDLNDGATSGSEENHTEMSMEDTIRNTLADINSRSNVDEQSSELDGEGSTVENESKSSLDEKTEEHKANRVRDEHGRFVTSAKKEDVVAEEPLAGTIEEQADQPEVSQANDENLELSAAPNTWKKEAKEAFLKADPIVRAEVLRREQDFHRGIQQYKSAAEFGTTIDQVISPYKQTMQQLGITPERALSGLLAADHKLRFSDPETKHMYFAQLAQSYGVDLNKVIDTAHTTDPRIYQLHEQNQQAQQQLDMYKKQWEMQEQQQLNSQVAAFAADPSHKYFNEVREQMAQLLQGGAAKDLQDAYDQAVYLNPSVRSQLLQQQVELARKEADRKAKEARVAATPPVRSKQPLPSEEKVGSMEDTIRQTYRKLHGIS